MASDPSDKPIPAPPAAIGGVRDVRRVLDPQEAATGEGTDIQVCYWNDAKYSEGATYKDGNVTYVCNKGAWKVHKVG